MNTIVVFARAATPGTCKTRLAKVIGDVRAAELYRAMTRDTLERLSAIDVKRRVLFADGELIAPPGWDLVQQPAGDLTSRLIAAFALGRDTICIGSDAPCAPLETLAHPMSADVTMGPSRDGGYWAIGMRELVRDLLVDMPWSTAVVANETSARTQRLGLSLATLPGSFDVDEASDLTILDAALRESPGIAPHTRAYRETMDR